MIKIVCTKTHIVCDGIYEIDYCDIDVEKKISQNK